MTAPAVNGPGARCFDFRPIATALALLDRRAVAPRKPDRQDWTDLELLILSQHLRPKTIETLRTTCVGCASMPEESRGSMTPKEEAALAAGAVAVVNAVHRLSVALEAEYVLPPLDGSALSTLASWAIGLERRFIDSRPTKSRGGRRQTLGWARAFVTMVAFQVRNDFIRPATGESRFMQVMHPAFALAGFRTSSERAVAAYIRSMRNHPDRLSRAYWGDETPRK